MNKIKLLLFLIFALCLTACGGGTIGTDDNLKRSFKGTILDSSGEPVANVEVVNLNSGNETTSDKAGNFILRGKQLSGDTEILFRHLSSEQIIVIPNLNENDANILISIEISTENGNISLISFSVEERESNNIDENNSNSASQNTDDKTNNETQKETLPIKSLIKGKIVDTNGNPISSIIVNPIGYRVTGKTGNKGRFSFEIPFGKKSLVLGINYLGEEKRITVSNLPNYAYILNFEIEIDFSTSAKTPGIQTTSIDSVSILNSGLSVRE